ncbi:alpha-amylase family glycosyl hydrolase [Clostridium butyricum]|uniref:alpha-amylase family glycosyl hydrolase n=1 Tax=Clostridium butyricum TaxID=1492 RepID=UPI00325BE262
MSREIIFQAFNYKLNDVKGLLSKIAEQGFNVIQVSPLQQHKEKDNPTWWLAYQITNFQIGNRLGNVSDLINLCKEADKYGIKIIVDCVFNHTANDNNNNYIPSEEVDYNIRSRQDFFLNNRRSIEDYNNRWQVVNWDIDLPSLNYNNKEYQDIVIEYLNSLISCGVKGFRFDACRHIPTNTDYDKRNNCNSNFWERVLSHLNNKEQLFMYGEVLDSSTELVDSYCKYMNVGINNNSGSYKSELVKWFLSHDDINTFGIAKDKYNRDVTIREWEYLLKTNRDSSVLFYPFEYDNTWEDKEIKRINNTYK